MARLAFVAADPDGSRLLQHVQADAEARHHEVVSVPPGSPPAAGSLASFDLVVYEFANDEGSLPGYRLAATSGSPGLVVLADGRIDRVLDALVKIDRAEADLAVREGAMAVAARRPAGEPDETALCLRLARRATAVVVRTEAARASLETLGCRTAILVGDAAVGSAIDAALARAENPVRQALARWGSALAAVGVRPEEVEHGLGARYADAVEALTNPVGRVLPRS
jgi:hypothetical protein